MSQAAGDGGPVGAGLEDRGRAEQTQRPRPRKRVRGLRCSDAQMLDGGGPGCRDGHGEGGGTMKSVA
jgi:hypothetical protein